MKILVIGAGRVGQPLSEALKKAGHDLTLLRRSDTVELQLDVSGYDLIFLTVPDEAVPSLALKLRDSADGKLVHCAGRLPNKGVAGHAAMFHPFMSFTGTESGQIFEGCPVGISGPLELVKNLKLVASQIGAVAFDVDEEHKEMYHLAAVMVSSFPLALLDGAAKFLAAAGVEGSATDILGPIYRKALDNAQGNLITHGTTGPLSRGDTAAIEGHLSSLATYPATEEIYRAINLYILENLDDASPNKNEIRALLKNQDPYDTK